MTRICRGNLTGPSGMFAGPYMTGPCGEYNMSPRHFIVARTLDAVPGSAESGSAFEQCVETRGWGSNPLVKPYPPFGWASNPCLPCPCPAAPPHALGIPRPHVAW
jgi:hypothetical protein